jgi:hypothetical protein
MRRVPHRFESDPIIEAYKRDLDWGSIRLSKRLTVAERVQRLLSMQQLAAELHQAGKGARLTQK